MDKCLTISIGKAPVRTCASHARAFHVSCQTNVSSPLPSSSVLAKIDQQIWSKPFVVSSSVRCIIQELQWKERWIFHSFFHHFFANIRLFVLRGEHKKRGSPMTKAVVKQHR